MKHKKLLVMALAAVMSVSALTVSAIAKTPTDSTQETTAQASRCQSRHGRHGAKEEIQAPENAIGKDAAKEAALKDANLTEADTEKVRAHLSALEDGTVIYKVHFTAKDKWYSYQIDALTGKVLDKSEEDAQEHAEAKQHGKRKTEAADAAGSETSSGKQRSKGSRTADAVTGASEGMSVAAGTV